nr:phosphotransferase [uncultured Treponema sp.]
MNSTNTTDTLSQAEIFKRFAIYGDLVSFKSFGGGHINGTYLSVWNQAGTQVRYTHQRINRRVFQNPAAVIENIRRITEHIAAKLIAEAEPAATIATQPTLQPGTAAVPVSRQALTLIPAKDGRFFYLDPAGEYWRTYLFIEDAVTYERMESSALARKAGAAIGAFQRQLSDYRGPALHETIPDFHNMHSRYDQLDHAVAHDVAGRLAEVRAELAFLEANRARGMILSDGLARGTLPRGITHNDTKLNNILFDAATGNALCIIDLDTVMPGTVLFDTGDLIRTAANTACEDEPDLSKVRFDTSLFAALIDGYLSTASSFLTPAEKSLIAESGRVLTQIMAVRFLTDYLNGDRYYKISRPTHNLDRARSQIALIRSMDSQWERILHIVGQTS